jgi:hypothetical protein
MSPFQRYRTIFRICRARRRVDVGQFAGVIRVRPGHAADARSVLGVMGLGATSGRG